MRPFIPTTTLCLVLAAGAGAAPDTGGRTALMAAAAAGDAARAPAAAPADTGEFAEDVLVDVVFPDWFKQSFLDLDVDLAEALEAGRQGIMVFVSTRRCSYCKAFIDRSLARPDIRERLAGERLTAREWYAGLGLSYRPAVVLFDAGGREAMRIDSETQRYRMAGTLQLVLEGAHRDDSQLQRWRRDKVIESLQAEAAP